MSKKLTVLLSLTLAVCFAFSACNKRIVLVDKDEVTSSQETTLPAYTPDTTQDTAAAETTTAEVLTDTSPDSEAGSSEYRRMNMDTETVISLYRSAMNDVKTVAPGISRYESLSTDDVVAGNGNSDIANSILDIVASSILEGSDNNSTKRIIKGDTDAVTEYFPLYGSTQGCTLYDDTSVVNSAVCYSGDSEYKIEIELNDCLNPGSDSSFTGIMNPVDIDSMKEGISRYLVVLDRSQYQFDMNYTGCEIVCILDKQTSRMKSLSMTMIIDVAININISVGFWSSDLVKCTGTLTDCTVFSDFNW